MTYLRNSRRLVKGHSMFFSTIGLSKKYNYNNPPGNNHISPTIAGTFESMIFLLTHVGYVCSHQNCFKNLNPGPSLAKKGTSWWFQFFLKIFIPTWGRFPFWLIFFRWVETTNQFCCDKPTVGTAASSLLQIFHSPREGADVAVDAVIFSHSLTLVVYCFFFEDCSKITP